ncbi:hypothetical protein EVAR_62391_1 [Eumeta japonica]|uniref:Uncharacterized protein n=1 Tax=Eumeta variegata TaxID=151549 RepID=A0A4C1YWN5_EUMVA|nr:hypothetical protein EVAR_62391_1 [Eumeta japonica]
MKYRRRKNPERICFKSSTPSIQLCIQFYNRKLFSTWEILPNKTVVLQRIKKNKTTLGQTTVEIRKAKELFQLFKMDVKACTEQRKRRTGEKQKEHTFPLYLLTL